jgi:hypothetical protein
MKPGSSRMLWYGAALLVLALVFMLYTRADFMLNIANQVWGCF